MTVQAKVKYEERVSAKAILVPFSIFLEVIRCLLLAIYVWVPWTLCGLGAMYGYMLPELFQSIPFWHTLGLLFFASGLKQAIYQPTIKLKSEDITKARLDSKANRSPQ